MLTEKESIRMSFREMVLQQGQYSDNHYAHETESTLIVSMVKSQSPFMIGWLAIMGLNLIFLLTTFL